MDDGLLRWLILAVDMAVGASLIVFARPITEHSRRKAAAAKEKHGHKPALLRPKIANENPSVLKTRLVGAGFLAIGAFIWFTSG